MRVGFTGTRKVPDKLTEQVKCWVWTVSYQADEFTTGACVGFDSIAAWYLSIMRPQATHRLVVPADRSQVDMDLVRAFTQHMIHPSSEFPGAYVVEFMPEGTTYKQRNQRIVEHADSFAACVGYPKDDGHSRRSGSWQTVRLAREAGMEPNILTLSELEAPDYED